MKVERISEHIWSLQAWALIPIRVWLVRDGRGVTLVDAGIPSMARGIMRTVEQLGAGPLVQIVLTHGHPDHVGAIARIVKDQRSVAGEQIPVYAHPIEITFMEGDVAYPRRNRAQATVKKGLVEPLGEQHDGNLQAIAGLQPCLTPGHSPGHVVYYHEGDRVLLGGDLLMSRRGLPRKPMAIFTGDMAEALCSAEIVRQLRPLRLEVAHAGPVFDPADKMDGLLPEDTRSTRREGARPPKRKGSA